MKVLITDDEPLARSRLRALVETCAGMEIAGEACNGKEALELAGKLAPDIILMDIRMPGMDGLEAATHLSASEKPPAVIFTTAYGDHALAAFEANAIDYLLKPIRKQRLEQALTKAQRLDHGQLRALREDGDGHQARTHICVQSRRSMQLIPLTEIIYFHAEHKYVAVRHCQGENLIEESLKNLEQEFGDQFIRIHRSTLVSTAFLTGIEKTSSGHRAILHSTADRPKISRRHMGALKDHLNRAMRRHALPPQE